MMPVTTREVTRKNKTPYKDSKPITPAAIPAAIDAIDLISATVAVFMLMLSVAKERRNRTRDNDKTGKSTQNMQEGSTRARSRYS